MEFLLVIFITVVSIFVWVFVDMRIKVPQGQSWTRKFAGAPDHIPASGQPPNPATARPLWQAALVVRLWPPRAGASWLAGMLVLLCLTTPRAWAQTKLWEFSTGAEANGSAVVGADGTIYFGSLDKSLYALDPASGTARWRFPTAGGVLSAPALGAGDTVYFGSLDGWLYAVRSAGDPASATAQLLWRFQTGGQIYSSPAVGVDGMIYVGSLDGNLYALRPDGSKKWQFKTGGGIVSSAAVGDDGTVYVGSRDEHLYAISPAGTKKWDFATGGEVDSSPAIGSGNSIYVGTVNAKLYALSPAGTKLWEYGLDERTYSSPAVGLDGTVYVPSFNGRVYALRPDGTKQWDTLVAAGRAIEYSSIAVAADGTLYVGAHDGKLYALSRDGVVKWAFATGATINYSSPTIGPDGTVYIGSEDHKLYAVGGGSPPARGAWPMFRRDARHTASGFVEREFSRPFYVPGLGMVVTLIVRPPPGVTFYKVEDEPPAGWRVGAIGDNGSYNAGTVRFGPFLDDGTRQLTYQVTPPPCELGPKSFVGISFADGSPRLLGGDHVLNSIPLHPADMKPVDGWMSAGELTAYVAAWKTDGTWPCTSPIANDYLERAVELWRQGEGYWYNTNYSAPPLWWTPSADPPSGLAAPGPLPGDTVAPNGIAIASMSLVYEPGSTLRVAIAVTPAAQVVAQAIEDQPPAGWVVGRIDNGGFLDAVRGKVKWGPFVDGQPRSLSYELTPPSGATNLARFNGTAAFDDQEGAVGGQRFVQPRSSSLPDLFAARHLPASYSAGAALSVTIETQPLVSDVYWAVDETPPAGWTVGAISDGGYFDSGSGVIRFGPFFDGQARALTYQLTPPLTETDVARFSGMFEIDFVPGWIAGDLLVGSIALHPADQPLVDAWMTVSEVTAYGAAWKQRTTWPTGPSAVLSSYLVQAVALWQNGEAYRYDASAGPAPFCWTSLPSGVAPAYPVPPVPTVGTGSSLGTAACIMPSNVLPGTNLTVLLKIVPAMNATVYAVEDQPPAGWALSNITGGGLYDAKRGKLKWGPFFDSSPRTFSYAIMVPADATGVAPFLGAAAFDNTRSVITGVRAPFIGVGAPTGTFVVRHLPPGYSPGKKMTVMLEVFPLANVDYVVVEEVVPVDWAVGAISDLGVYSAGSDHTVRFGIYLDGRTRTLTYEATPPLSESGAVEFDGIALANEARSAVGGDHVIGLSPLHPCDADPIDGWITIGELTAYGAAWKQGDLWGVPSPPQAIQPEYLIRAIELWLGGELYGLDSSFTNAPFWWVNLTNAVPPSDVPVPIQPGSVASDGSAVVTMPQSFQPGVPMTVAITVTPKGGVLNYAAEDRPPEGWEVLPASISVGGGFDALRGKVKWGPFFTNAPLTLSYQVVPPANAGDVGRFVGGAAFDGVTADFVGPREIIRSGDQLPRFTSVRLISDAPELRIQGPAGRVSIESSTNLVNWAPLATLTNNSALPPYVDTSATNRTWNFYRAVWQ